MESIVYIAGRIIPVGIILKLFIQVVLGIITYIGVSKLLKIQELDTIVQLIQVSLKRLNNYRKESGNASLIKRKR